MHLDSSRDSRLTKWNLTIRRRKRASAVDKQGFSVEWRIEFCTNRTSGPALLSWEFTVLLYRKVDASEEDATERSKGSEAKGPVVLARWQPFLSRTKELTKHDNHNGHKSHNWCGGGTDRRESLSPSPKSMEPNKYYFDNRPTWRARSSVIRPQTVCLLRNHGRIMRVAIGRRDEGIIGGARKQSGCRQLKRDNYESFRVSSWILPRGRVVAKAPRSGHVKRFLYEVVTRIMPLVAGRAFRDHKPYNVATERLSSGRATLSTLRFLPRVLPSHPIPPSRRNTFLIRGIWDSHAAKMGSPSSCRDDDHYLSTGVTRCGGGCAAFNAMKVIMVTIRCIGLNRNSDILYRPEKRANFY